MMTNKKHLQIIKELTTKHEKELQEARDLTRVIQDLTQLSMQSKTTLDGFKFVASGGELRLPDNAPVYVDDLLGGKVIKQEGTKCIVIEKDGSVKTGLTKAGADKGFNYKLIQK